MKILITGGAGLIGSELTKALVKLGHNIIVYDFRDDISGIREVQDQIQIIKADVRDFEHIKRAVIGCDGIIHLAGVSRVIWGYEDPKACVDININGMINVLEAARISVKKPWVIFSSSREIYGESNKLPVTEESAVIIHNIYAVTKVACENLCKQYYKDYGLRVGILRYSNVYGSEFDQLDRVAPKFILRAAKDQDICIEGGGQILDFTHMSDTVQGTIKLIAKISESDSYYDFFHITTGKGTTLQELAQIVFDTVKTKSKISYNPKRKYDVEKFYADPAKAKKLLGYYPKIDIRKGVRLLAERLVPGEKLK